MANRYMDMTQQELAQACNDWAADLLQVAEAAGPKGDRAREAAQVLLAAARMLDVPTPVERAAEQGAAGFARALDASHQERLRHERYRTLQMAISAAGPAAGPRWLADAHVDGRHAYELALESEDGLAAVVAHLAELAASGSKGGGRGRQA